MESSSSNQLQLNKSVFESQDQNPLLTQPNTLFQPQRPKKALLDESNKYGKEIERDYNRLQDIIDNLQTKVDKIIKAQEDDFMIAYKEQMTEIQKELKAMKRKIDEEALRQKADEKKRILEEERDYFREEALRLDRLCQEQLRTIEELRFKLKITNEEKNYYEGFVIDSKKENKALKYELLQLYKHRMEDQKAQQRIGSVQGQRTIHVGRPSTEELQSGAKEDLFGHDVSKRELSSKLGQKTGLFSAKPGDMQSTQDFYKRDMSSQQMSRFHHSEKDQKLRDTEELRMKVEELEKKIVELKNQAKKDKAVIQKLKVELTGPNCERGNLENVLLDCVNEVKKEISLRQQQQRSYLKVSDSEHQKIEVDYKSFTHEDKKNLLKKYLSTDDFLDQLYHITFHSSISSSSVVKLNEKWKRDASEAQKQFGNFQTYKFKNIISQPILKHSMQRKDLASSYNNFTDKTKGLLEKIIKN